MNLLSELVAQAANHAASGRVDDALAAYRGALALAPTRAELHHNLGALLYFKRELAAAQRSFEEAGRLRPEWIAPLLALGHLHFRAGRYAGAERAFERALGLDARSIEALGNLGVTLQRRGRADAALPHLKRARELAPDDVHAWFALRTTLLSLGNIEEAVQDFLRFETGARRLSAELVTTGLMFSRFLGDPSYERKYLPLALDWPYRPDQVELAAVTLARAQYCDVPRETLLGLYERYNALQQAIRGASAPLVQERRRDDGDARVRVGYVSADFRSHVMGRIMRDVIAAHDRARFTVSLYSLAPAGKEDALTAEFRLLADGFTSVAEFDDVSAARVIAEDGIDVLVDLMGHSAMARPGILLWKPAPVIITHLGYHGCVGLEQVDFKLTDAFADPSDAATMQIEAPLALDTCVLPVRRVRPAEQAVSTRTALGTAGSAVVFGAFASLIKLSPRCLALWREILERVPDAVLALSPLGEEERPMYLRRLGGFGIPASRIVFIPPGDDDASSRTRYRLIDIVLDTLPYTGGDTTAAALDMAVPVVTRVGERHAERVSYSLLAHLGVTETVARTDDEYVALACRLAGDAGWRHEVSARINARLPASGLAAARRYAQSLEDAYLRAVLQKRAAVAEADARTVGSSFSHR